MQFGPFGPTQQVKLNSRRLKAICQVRFVIDLRKTSGTPCSETIHPKEMDQMHKEAHAEQCNVELLNFIRFGGVTMGGSKDTVLEGFNIDTAEHLNGVAELVFEKATQEPNSSVAYAQLCYKLSEHRFAVDDGTNTFKKTLIMKCQNEFENLVIADEAIPLQKIAESTDPGEKAEYQLNYEDEKRKLRVRSVGTVRFIGELFNMGMLTKNVMMTCVSSLLDRNSEYKLECLCKLLTTIGARLEDKKNNLGECCRQMREIADRKNQDIKISNRVRFMIQDVIDLWKKNWISRTETATPKKMGQIQKEADAERCNIRLLNFNISSAGRGDGGGNRRVGLFTPKSGNRGGMTNEDGWMIPSTKARSLIDPSKIMLSGSPRKARSLIDPSKIMLSGSPHDDVQRAVPDEDKTSKIKVVASELLLYHNRGKMQLESCYKEIESESEKYRWAIVRELYNASVDMQQLKSTDRAFAGQAVSTWINRKLITVDDNLRALKEFLEPALDLVCDVPMLWQYVAEVITPIIKNDQLSLVQLRSVCPEEQAMQKLLQTFIPYAVTEHGPQFMRNLFKACKWSDLIGEKDVEEFVIRNKFEFVDDGTVAAQRTSSSSSETSIELIQQRVKQLLHDGAGMEHIQEFITVNRAQIDKEFIRALSTVVGEILMEEMQQKSVDMKEHVAVLAKYIGDNKDMQLECLNAILLLMIKLEHPKSVLQTIFSRLHDNFVVSKDVFERWRDSNEMLAGKGVAMATLRQFFDLLDREGSSGKGFK